MSTLAEIETAAEGLTPDEQQELVVFLLSRLGARGGPLPEPRTFSEEQIAGWIAEDEREGAEIRKLLSQDKR
jgi:hypothetical protein